MSTRKTVCVTYHMHRGNTTVETCINLPMDAEIADDLIKGDYCMNTVFLTPQLRAIVTGLALLQGYGDGTIQDIRFANPREESS